MKQIYLYLCTYAKIFLLFTFHLKSHLIQTWSCFKRIKIFFSKSPKVIRRSPRRLFYIFSWLMVTLFCFYNWPVYKNNKSNLWSCKRSKTRPRHLHFINELLVPTTNNSSNWLLSAINLIFWVSSYYHHDPWSCCQQYYDNITNQSCKR